MLFHFYMYETRFVVLTQRNTLRLELPCNFRTASFRSRTASLRSKTPNLWSVDFENSNFKFYMNRESEPISDLKRWHGWLRVIVGLSQSCISNHE